MSIPVLGSTVTGSQISVESTGDPTFRNLEVTMLFAPVCRLSDGAVAAAELQLRGPQGSALDTPAALKRAARLMQQTAVMDRRKREFVDSPAARSVAAVLPLLVTADLDLYDDVGDWVVSALERHVVAVLPENVRRHPRRTLAKVAAARRAGRAICIDGLAATEHAGSLLSLIEPDMIITGPELLRRNADPDMAQLAQAIAAHAERSHAVVVAEGVDDPGLRSTAITMGASYGIGALYPAVTDPATLTGGTVVPLPETPVWSTPSADESSPFAIASASIPPREGTKRLLIEMSKALERQAQVGGADVVLGTFQRAEFFTTATAARWAEMSETTGVAGVYGVGLVNMYDGNLHFAPLDPHDALVDEWNVLVLGPHFAGLLSARDCHGGEPELERTFDFVQSYDRVTVTQAVRAVLSRFDR